VFASIVALGVTGCSKAEDRVPELATKTAEQPLNQPATIQGCLRSGEAPNTFVLTSAKAEGATETVTYQLFPKEGIDLHPYAGQDVEVSGTIRSDQIVATSGEVQEKPAKGAQGTPTVETTSQLDVRKFDVQAVKVTGNRCAER